MSKKQDTQLFLAKTEPLHHSMKDQKKLWSVKLSKIKLNLLPAVEDKDTLQQFQQLHALKNMYLIASYIKLCKL